MILCRWLPDNKFVRRAAYFLGVTLLTLNLLEFPRQVYNITHDASGFAGFEYYAAHQFQFGRQVLLSIGPYGYIHYSYVYCGYLPVQKIVLKNFYRLALVLLILWVATRLPGFGLKLCWWAAFFVFQPFTWSLEVPGAPEFMRFQEMEWEQDYGYLTVYLAALYLLQNRKDWAFRLISPALLLLLAFAALTKHTTFVLAVGAAALVVAQKLIRREWREGAATVFLFAGFIVAHWVMAGQQLANLPGFVHGIFAFTSGYNEAQATAGPVEVTLIGLGIVGLLGLRSIYNFWALNQGIPRTVLELLLLYVAWKHGFVLEHFSHVLTFFFAAICLALLIFYLVLPLQDAAPARMPLSPKWRRFAVSDVTVITTILLSVVALWRSAAGPCNGPGTWGRYYPSHLAGCLSNNLQWMLSPRTKMAAIKEELKQAENFWRLPKIRERVRGQTVDFFGNTPGWIFLNHLNWWPRPMPLAYAAWNDQLASANERFYRDPKLMPEYVVCQIGFPTALPAYSPFDRFIPQKDPLAVRALMDNYFPVLGEEHLLLLKKNDALFQARFEKKLVVDEKTTLGDKVYLGEFSNQILWAEIEVRRSLLGRVVSFLYKPKPCHIAYGMVGGGESGLARYLTSLGGSGFMLTPVIQNNQEFLRFYGKGDGLNGFQRLEWFGLGVAPGDEKFFEKEIRVRLYVVERPAHRISLSSESFK